MTRLAADRLAGALTLLLLAGLSLAAWLFSVNGLQGPSVHARRAPETLKASLQQVQIQRTDLDGQRLYVIQAESGALNEEGAMTLLRPVLERLVEGTQQTRMRAGLAELSADQAQLRLSEGVLTTQSRGIGASGQTALTTQTLVVRPLEDRASTTAEVRVEQPGRILTGQGLELDLKTGLYRVLSNTQLELKR